MKVGLNRKVAVESVKKKVKMKQISISINVGSNPTNVNAEIIKQYKSVSCVFFGKRFPNIGR